jgi:Mg2+/Co2+ transporter CorB
MSESRRIAEENAVQLLRELGDESAFSEDELKTILKAAFASQKRSEDDKDRLRKGIVDIIDNAVRRRKQMKSEGSI